VNDRLTHALRALDAAEAPILDAAELRRADETMSRILASDPSLIPTGPPEPAPTRRVPPLQRSPRRRPALLVALAAATVVGGWIGFSTLGGEGVAYASWTAVPAATTKRDTELAQTACRQAESPSWLSRVLSWGDSPSGPSFDWRQATVALAERRGDFVGLIIRTENPDTSVHCLVHLAPGSGHPDVVSLGVVGSSGPSPTPPARSFTQGGISSSDASSMVDGKIGADVVGVTIHTGRLTVVATVKDGWFGAWWPGPALKPVPPHPGETLRLGEAFTVDLTLTDGTIVHEARAAQPT
jgi:hypothetical protein